MKKQTFLLTFCVFQMLVPVAGGQSGPSLLYDNNGTKIYGMYDKFRDETILTAMLGRIDGGTLALQGRYSGAVRKRPYEQFLSVIEESGGSPYDEAVFRILADGNRFQITPASRRRDSSGDLITLIPLTLEQLSSVSKADSVEGQLGLKEFKLTRAQQESIGRFVDYCLRPEGN